MPEYQYQCTNCKTEYAVRQSMKDPRLVRCNVCGKDTLEILIQRTGLIFKGDWPGESLKKKT